MRRTSLGTVIWGVVLISLGVGFMLNSLEVIDFNEFFGHYWPVILLIIAAAELLQNKMASALIWAILGVALLSNTLEIYTFDVGELIGPVFLIIIGVSIILRTTQHPQPASDSSQTVSATTAFGDTKKKIDSQSFSRGTVNTFFGDTKLDLRTAKLSGEGAVIDVLVAFGATTIYVPKDMLVRLEATALLGGSEDKRLDSVGNAQGKPTLTVKGLVMFGGLEIKD